MEYPLQFTCFIQLNQKIQKQSIDFVQQIEKEKLLEKLWILTGDS
jgi:hypothetical protein